MMSVSLLSADSLTLPSLSSTACASPSSNDHAVSILGRPGPKLSPAFGLPGRSEHARPASESVLSSTSAVGAGCSDATSCSSSGASLLQAANVSARPPMRAAPAIRFEIVFIAMWVILASLEGPTSYLAVGEATGVGSDRGRGRPYRL